MIYQALKALLKQSLYVYFKKIEVVGQENLPPQGLPTIFLGNHPNSLLDPAMICTHAQRDIYFAAKDTLFSQSLVSQLLTTLKAVPIKRKMDHGDQVDNQDSFQRLNQVLSQGNAIGIFPEGISHHESQLAQFKTGIARIAYSMIEETKQDLYLVPCGLYYQKPGSFRTSAFIQFGQPLVLKATTTGWQLFRCETKAWSQRIGLALQDALDEKWFERDEIEDENQKIAYLEKYDLIEEGNASQIPNDQRVKWLTQRLDITLRTLTINADDWDTIHLLDLVRRLYQPNDVKVTLEQKVELSKRFNTYYPQIAHLPDIQQLVQEIKSYQDDLYDLGLSDSQMTKKTARTFLFLQGIKQILLCALWFPLALLTSWVHLPIALLIRYGAFSLSPRKDVLATTKFLMGVVLINGMYLSLSLALAYFYHWQYLFLPFLFLLSGYATLKMAEEWHRFRRTGWVLMVCLVAKNYIFKLRQRRMALQKAILTQVDLHLPKDITRVFYQQADDLHQKETEKS